MPRQARVIIPNTPHHIVQRGHNRQVVFTSDDDFSFYKENLTHYKEEFGCKVYAYCFMSNHVHLLIDPGDEPESISLTIKRVAGRQTRYVNKLKNGLGAYGKVALNQVLFLHRNICLSVAVILSLILYVLQW